MRARARVATAQRQLGEEWDRFSASSIALTGALGGAWKARASLESRVARARAYLLEKRSRAQLDQVLVAIHQIAHGILRTLLRLQNRLSDFVRYCSKHPVVILRLILGGLLGLAPLVFVLLAFAFPVVADVFTGIALVAMLFLVWLIARQIPRALNLQARRVRTSVPPKRKAQRPKSLRHWTWPRKFAAFTSDRAASALAVVHATTRAALRLAHRDIQSKNEASAMAAANQARAGNSNWSLELLSWSKKSLSYFSVSILSLSWGSVSLFSPSFCALSILAFALMGDGQSPTSTHHKANAPDQITSVPVPTNIDTAKVLPAPTITDVADIFSDTLKYYWVLGSDSEVRRQTEAVFAAPFPAWTFASKGCGRQMIVAYGTASSDGSVKGNLGLARKRAARVASLVANGLSECADEGVSETVVVAIALGESREPLPNESQRALFALGLSVEHLSSVDERALRLLLRSNAETAFLGANNYTDFVACAVRGATLLPACDASNDL